MEVSELGPGSILTLICAREERLVLSFDSFCLAAGLMDIMSRPGRTKSEFPAPSLESSLITGALELEKQLHNPAIQTTGEQLCEVVGGRGILMQLWQVSKVIGTNLLSQLIEDFVLLPVENSRNLSELYTALHCSMDFVPEELQQRRKENGLTAFDFLPEEVQQEEDENDEQQDSEEGDALEEGNGEEEPEGHPDSALDDGEPVQESSILKRKKTE